jgi:hypothetical protein
MVQHQETAEPETSEVIHLAQQLYERDRAEQERRSSLAAAAEEVGIPSEYLTKAAMQLKSRQASQATVVPVQAVQQRSRALFMIVLGVAMALFMLAFITALRSQVAPPYIAPVATAPAAIQAEPPHAAPAMPGDRQR